MKALAVFLVALSALLLPSNAHALSPSPALRCVAFSPYTEGDPNAGLHPSAARIAELLDRLIQQTSARCVMTYGVLNGLDAVFPAAQARGIQVVAIVWLDNNSALNDTSIAAGIAAAKAYPGTIVRLSCGSEVRTRRGNTYDSEIIKCIDGMRAAGVTQPITSIDTWWEWCNRNVPCATSSLAAKVDWIGINVFPWWENRYSGIFPCTSAEEAADFHIARMQQVMDRYPAVPVILTEFGWPSGPLNYREVPNQFTGQQCGLASPSNQSLVIKSTLAKLRERDWSGFVFSAFREPFKASYEGPAGPYWGMCLATKPYRCSLSDLFARADLVVDFGTLHGQYLWANDNEWRLLHPFSASATVADLDNNTEPDLVLNFGPLYGVWVLMNGSSWFQLHSLSPRSINRADLDGDGVDDLIMDFGLLGIWAYRNGSTWDRIHSFQAERIAVADVEGNGRDDVIIDFGSPYGVWLLRDGQTWSPLTGESTSLMIVADIDGSGKDDVVLTVTSQPGLLVWLNDASWVKIHSLSPPRVAAGDTTATGRDALIIDFGSPYGIWEYRFGDAAPWIQLHQLSAQRFVAADLDASGKTDIVIDFGAPYGIWVWKDDAAWLQLHIFSSVSVQAGEIVR